MVQNQILGAMSKAVGQGMMDAVLGNCQDHKIRENAQKVIDRISDEEMRRRKQVEYEQFQREFKSGLHFGR